MSLQQVTIHAVRNLREVSLTDLARVNVLAGANGTGKTSVLEAIHLLGMARSFRSGSASTLIQHGATACVVYGRVVPEANGARPYSLGVQRSLDGELLLRKDGESLRTVAEIVAMLPLQVINASSFELLTGSPSARRQYLNWGVFHVEHAFFPAWKRFQRCIKQRNSILRRDKLADDELSAWTDRLVLAGEEINNYRQVYFRQLAPLFREIMDRLLPGLGELELRLRQGWDRRLSYAESLQASRVSDREKGFTHTGPQRADLRVTVEGRSAADTLSRGQQKMVVCGLKLAQGELMRLNGASVCTYLVDDLPSELDSAHAARVCAELENLQAQVFITCVAHEDVSAVWPAAGHSPAMFHVEHGEVSRA